MDSSSARPPKPRLAFRVGVVGHRWDKLAPGPLEGTIGVERALGTTVRGILDAIKHQVEAIGQDPANGYAAGGAAGARLTLISGLAEGADRIVADQGLEAGYQLAAVLPFEPARYAEDFDGQWLGPTWSRPTAVAEYERLLRHASAIVVLDGRPGQADAYEPLGRSILNHADLLIAIWDGEGGRGPGGTASVLMAARREELPIVRIHPQEPDVAWLEDIRDPNQGAEKGTSRLARRIGDLVLPPEESGLTDRSVENGRRAFFSEQARAGHLGTSYRALTGYLGNLNGLLASALVPTCFAWLIAAYNVFRRRLPMDYPAASAAAWAARWGDLDPELRGRLVDQLAPVHGWLDYLATYYADRYRSAFTMVFSLAWIAGVAAVMGLIAEVRGWGTARLWGGVELAVIGAILGLTMWGKHRRFHERWIDYRLLAEQIRHLTFLWPLGVTSVSARLSANPSSDDPRVRWTGWYYRALVRQLGFATRTVSADHLANCRYLLRDREIQEQRVYHDLNSERLEHLAHVVHRRTEVLFGMAGVVAVLHLAHWSEAFLYSAGLTALSVFLPARAAALHGWAGHADFHAAGLRSADIELRLEELERAIDGLIDVSTTTLGPVALAAARTMESELGSWRATSLSRPLERV